jgi:hypothetical protein
LLKSIPLRRGKASISNETKEKKEAKEALVYPFGIFISKSYFSMFAVAFATELLVWTVLAFPFRPSRRFLIFDKFNDSCFV